MLVCIVAAVIVILILVLTYYFLMKNTQNVSEEITLSNGEVATVGDLVVTHKGGGHKILMDGGDLQYAVFDLNIKGTDKTEEFSTAAIRDTNQVSWNGYSIEVKKIVGDGDSLTLLITKQ